MLKVAVAGCGLISTAKHIPVFTRLKDKARVIAVCDLNKDTAGKAAERFHIKGIYADFSKMLSAERPDIVDICTPPGTHAGLAIEAMEKGADLLIEKPMAVELSDCDRMIEASLKNRKTICVMHNQLFNPAFMQAAERLRTGEIGDFIGIDISLSTPAAYMTLRKDHWAHRLPGGVVGETGPHAVYLALSFLKQVHGAEVQARKVLPKCPWSRFEDFRINLIGVNGIASIKLIYASDQWAASLDIIGTKGRLVVDLEAQSVIRYDRCRLDPVSIGLSKLADGSQKLVSLMSNGLKEILGLREDCHAIGIRRFLESVLKAKQPPVTAYDAREVVRVTRMIVEKLPEAAG